MYLNFFERPASSAPAPESMSKGFQYDSKRGAACDGVAQTSAGIRLLRFSEGAVAGFGLGLGALSRRFPEHERCRVQQSSLSPLEDCVSALCAAGN